MYRNLGFEAICFDPIIHPIPPEHVKIALKHIHDSLDKGLPAISYGLIAHEFCIVYGYEDENQLLHVRDSKGEGTVPYDRLGDGKILTLTIESHEPMPYLESLRRGLGMVLAHGGFTEEGIDGFANGLSAYRKWIRAIEQRTADPLGHAYNVAFVHDARTFAVRFLQSVADKFEAGELKPTLPHG